MAYFYNRFAKWIENKNSGTQMTWWKTNFNMPVPDLWDDTSNWTEWEGPFIYHGVATSFDFSWFHQGWEAIISVLWLHIEWNEGGGTYTITQKWIHPSGSVMFTNTWNGYLASPGSDSQWVPNWHERHLAANQWVAPWEINQSGVYKIEATISWPGLNFTSYFDVTITNVPSFSWYKASWYMYLEWNQLCYTSANGFVQKMLWNHISSWSGTPGHVWINGIFLHYIDSFWDVRRAPYSIKQFASNFSNWAPGQVSGKTPWYLYIDNQFWWTHISLIWYNGYKYLTWDGHNPYIDPY